MDRNLDFTFDGGSSSNLICAGLNPQIWTNNDGLRIYLCIDGDTGTTRFHFFEATNNVALGGHVHVDDHAIIGGQTGVHQFVRIGAYAMVGGASGVLQDVPPYLICHLNPCTPAGLNIVGLRRAGFTDEQVRALRRAYGAFYRENLTAKAACEKIEAMQAEFPGAANELARFVEFIRASTRGVIR